MHRADFDHQNFNDITKSSIFHPLSAQYRGRVMLSSSSVIMQLYLQKCAWTYETEIIDDCYCAAVMYGFVLHHVDRKTDSRINSLCLCLTNEVDVAQWKWSGTRITYHGLQSSCASNTCGSRGKAYNQAQEVKICQMFKFLVLTCLKNQVLRTPYRFFYFAQAVEKDYAMSFIHACSTSFVDDTMWPRILLTNDDGHSAYYISMGKMLIRKKRSLPLLRSLDLNTKVENVFGISHLVWPCSYISTEPNIGLILKPLMHCEIGSKVCSSTRQRLLPPCKGCPWKCPRSSLSAEWNKPPDIRAMFPNKS